MLPLITLNCVSEMMERCFYIDYLDYTTAGNYSSEYRLLRLKYDLLVFSDALLLLSVPACIKIKETAVALSNLDAFWLNNRLKLQLDRKHKNNPKNYFSNRKRKLESSISEEGLAGHFEYRAYTSKHTDNFFGIYLPEVVGANPNSLYIDKEKDTDTLFRENAQAQIHKHFDDFSGALLPRDNIRITSIFYDIESYTTSNELFQRAIVEHRLDEKFELTIFEQSAVGTILDRSFALANAFTNSAIPLSMISNQLTGIWLAKLLKSCFPFLYEQINALSWNEVYNLSVDDEFRNMIATINSLVFLFQQNARRQDNYRQIHAAILQADLSINMYNFFKLLALMALDLLKDKMLEMGALACVSNLELGISLVEDCYQGKYKRLFETLRLVNVYAQRTYENIRYSDIMKSAKEGGQKQLQKGYSISE